MYTSCTYSRTYRLVAVLILLFALAVLFSTASIYVPQAINPVLRIVKVLASL